MSTSFVKGTGRQAPLSPSLNRDTAPILSPEDESTSSRGINTPPSSEDDRPLSPNLRSRETFTRPPLAPAKQSASCELVRSQDVGKVDPSASRATQIAPLSSTQLSRSVTRQAGRKFRSLDNPGVALTVNDTTLGLGIGMKRTSIVSLTTGEMKANEDASRQSLPYSPPPQSPSLKSGSKYFMISELGHSKTSPVQITTEIMNIYSSLKTAEAKCISAIEAQPKDKKVELSAEEWRILIDRHRNLLYEYFDFFMAIQHPSAPAQLKGLATKYNMLARMWKLGVHDLLEFSRLNRPESQDFMLAFIYLAYQMFALFSEVVQEFQDTWIECLGDLSRYRMAMEDNPELHVTWGDVALRWYTQASDRHPKIGRLYHHMGILEQSRLRKLAFYSKSLTSVINFPGAADSLKTLCRSILQSGTLAPVNPVHAGRAARAIAGKDNPSSYRSLDDSIVAFQVMQYAGFFKEITVRVMEDTLGILQYRNTRLRDSGSFIAIVNLNALFEFGSNGSSLFKLYTTIIDCVAPVTSKDSESQPTPETHQSIGSNLSNLTSQIACSPILSSPAFKFCFSFFNSVLCHYNKQDVLYEAFPYVHVNLAFLHGLHILPSQGHLVTEARPFSIFEPMIAWDKLATFLNCVVKYLVKYVGAIDPRLIDCARLSQFPPPSPENEASRMPLPEDIYLLGHIWCYFYHPGRWFKNLSADDARFIETLHTHKARAERIFWLGAYFAYHTDVLEFNERTKEFNDSKSTGNGPNL